MVFSSKHPQTAKLGPQSNNGKKLLSRVAASFYQNRSGSFSRGDETDICSRTAMCYARVSTEATAMRPNAADYHSQSSLLRIFERNRGLVLDCSSLSCNLGAINHSGVAFHMQHFA